MHKIANKFVKYKSALNIKKGYTRMLLTIRTIQIFIHNTNDKLILLSFLRHVCK